MNTLIRAHSPPQPRGYFLFKGWFRLNLAPNLLSVWADFWKPGTLRNQQKAARRIPGINKICSYD